MLGTIGTMHDDTTETDYLIVGGGSAGCVLANRLSANGARVTLLEAGIDTGGDREPAEIRDARFRTIGAPQFYWPDLTADTGCGDLGFQPHLQAKVLGGGSSINGMHAMRGLPRDFDEWRDAGIRGWGWDDVLPYFKRLETDCDFRDEQHGDSGPIHIQRVPRNDWSGLSRAMAQAMQDRGHPAIVDVNGEEGDGFGAVPMNYSGDRRMSSAAAYLTAEVRKRPNLTIITDANVSAITFENRRATGVRFTAERRESSIRAGETILCAGAIHSPALMLRSGIGAAADLKASGIEIVANRPGVGAALANHANMVVGAHICEAEARARAHVLAPSTMVIRYSSQVPGCPDTDMLINVWERTPSSLASAPMFHQIATFFPTLNKPFSRGSVKLNVAREIEVRFNALSDSRDLERLAGSMKFLDRLLRDPSVAPLVGPSFLPDLSGSGASLMQNTMKAQLANMAGAMALSGPAPLRDKMIENIGPPLAPLLEDEQSLRDTIRQSVMASGHSCGTCTMGDPENTEAVTDSTCKVIGIDRLRVVDASIFPSIVSAGTNLPVMMAAEKAAAMILAEAIQ